ncbi:MAG: hypothetical protein ACK5T6_21180, partial [Pirellula sp.]
MSLTRHEITGLRRQFCTNGFHPLHLGLTWILSRRKPCFASFPFLKYDRAMNNATTIPIETLSVPEKLLL